MAPSPQTPTRSSARGPAATIGELLERAGLAFPDTLDAHAAISGFEDDSRAVEPGALFIAVRGADADGHQYIAQALKKGACFVIAERLPDDSKEKAPERELETSEIVVAGKILLVRDTRALLGSLAHAYWGFPSRSLQVVGVTGTNGKTTTAYLVEAALRNMRRYPALFSTVEYRLGGEKREAGNTTPGAVELARLMALALERYADSVVMEVSSHALDQGRVDGVEFEAALITNLTQDHLDYHGDMEKYAQAKHLLFTLHHPRTAIFNLDDATARDFAHGHKGAKLTFSIDPRNEEADLTAVMLSADARGIEMSIRFRIPGDGEKTLSLRSPLRGRFNASNLLGAAAVCQALGRAPEQIVAALTGTPGAPGRFESVEAGQPFAIYVDYAHTPDALERLLENVRDVTGGRLIAVMGCGGDRDQGKRPKMGAIAGRLADYTIVTSDNPRTESPKAIAQAVEKGVKTEATSKEYEVILERRPAIARAIEMATQGDAVVVAGKGHEDYQEINGERTHFDDRETVRELCREILAKKSKGRWPRRTE